MIKTGYENIVGRPGILPYEPHEMDNHPDERLKATIAHIHRVVEYDLEAIVDEAVDEAMDEAMERMNG